VADAAILIEDGCVQSLGVYGAVRRTYPLARELDRRGLVALPALVDSHSHGRGLPLTAQGIEPGPLELFLARLTACTSLDPYDDAFVAAGDLLRTGVAAVQVFFHSFGDASVYRNGAEATAAGLEAAGIEFELVLGITDQNEFVPEGAAPDGTPSLASPARGLDPADFFAIFDDLAERWDREPTLGPVAPQWCSDEIWRTVAGRIGGGTRVHTHLLESCAQRSADPFATLVRFAVLGSSLSAAHAVWLSEEELAHAAKAGAALVYCPSSNHALGVGIAAIQDWLRAGVTSAFGMDSLAIHDPPDVFADLRLGRELSGLSASETLALATTGGAYALGRPELGWLGPGSAANVLLVPAPRLGKGEDVVTALLAITTREDVRELWVRGSRVVTDGVLARAPQIEDAKQRLLRDLKQDSDGRRARLAAVAAAEPWLRREWALNQC
jgi:5-methylthioadenosine/S-adenosylhomocysteine deaminase